MEKVNLYWPVYKNLEKEVLELSYSIHFCDTQNKIFSVKIAELIFRCAVEIEDISKSLYESESGDMKPLDDEGKERFLKYDFDCLKLLDIKWQLGKKCVVLTAPSMYFEKDENRLFCPLKNAHKGDMNWQKAYQSTKHKRVENLKKTNIRALIRGMAALYLLNLYYKGDGFEYGKMVEMERGIFESTLNSGSDLFAVKYRFIMLHHESPAIESCPDIVYIGFTSLEDFKRANKEAMQVNVGLIKYAKEKNIHLDYDNNGITVDSMNNVVYKHPDLQENLDKLHQEQQKITNKFPIRVMLNKGQEAVMESWLNGEILPHISDYSYMLNDIEPKEKQGETQA